MRERDLIPAMASDVDHAGIQDQVLALDALEDTLDAWRLVERHGLHFFRIRVDWEFE